MSEKIHVFEQAGLGKAPFRFVGYYNDIGPRKTVTPEGFVIEVGYAGQPMGTCEYCGHSIATCCEILSADGKHFIVGSDCVAKTGDEGLKVRVDEMKRKANYQRDLEKIEAGLVWAEENRSALSALPRDSHGSWMDGIEWFYKNAGRSGKLRIIKAAKIALEKSKGVAA